MMGRVTAFVFVLGWAVVSAAVDGAEPMPPATFRIHNGPLEVTFDAAAHTYAIVDTRTHRRWMAAATPGDFAVLATETNGDSSLTISLRDEHNQSQYRCRVTVEPEGVLGFEISAADPKAPFSDLRYPPRPQADLKHGMMLFCDRAGGNYVPLNDPKFSKCRLTVYANTDALDMPWLGIVDDEARDGMMVLAETPTEVTYALIPDAQGNGWPQVCWFSSLGTFGYDRRVSYRFAEAGGYVRLAKMFRTWAEANGLVKTLAQKAKERSRVEWLKGAMVVWGSDGLRFGSEARASGVKRAVINGRYPASDMQRMKDMGFLLGSYDNYSDIVDGDLGPTSDRVEEVAFREPDGTPRKGWLAKDGKQYYMRATSQALAAAQKLIPPILSELPYTARFLDVHSGIQLFEDYNPKHRDDRRMDLKYRQDLYAYIASLGLVVGGEHGKSWGVPYLDYTEGMMSGGFWWEMDTGHLLPLKSRDDISKDYLTYGINPATRIPLWELVYHDCLVTTWYWGDSNGYLYNVAPELSDRKDVLNALYGTVPLVWTNHLDYGWDRHRDRLLQTYYTTCPLHELTGFTAMLDHSFLSQDRLMQRTRFASGATVVANFADEAREYTAENGEKVMLAPTGFYVEGRPGVAASREWVDGAPLTRIHVGDFWYLGTSSGKTADCGPLRGSGSVAAFKADDGSWHIRAAGSGATVNVGRLCGADAVTYRVVELDSLGRPKAEVNAGSGIEVAALPGGDEARLFGILPGIAPEQPLVLASGEEISSEEAVTLSVASQDVTVRYTLDGSEPTATSVAYTAPFKLERGSIVKARSFRGQEAVSKTSEAAIRLTRPVGRTGVVRGGDKPVHVEIPVEGFDTMDITVTNAGDGMDYDQASLGNPRFVLADGSFVYLGDLKPVRVVYSEAKLVVDGGAKREPTRIGGETFERSIWVHAAARVVYAIDRRFTRFEAWAGVPDSTNPTGAPNVKNGSVEFVFSGVSAPQQAGTP